MRRVLAAALSAGSWQVAGLNCKTGRTSSYTTGPADLIGVYPRSIAALFGSCQTLQLAPLRGLDGSNSMDAGGFFSLPNASNKHEPQMPSLGRTC
ncbi:hypothetical protein PHYPSEUDO_013442 [Phytophthora pseudosyringae]|uniref:Uncharacterized protein n=1 Tax=Phytophthora pseudosyringae TaxID=221518 RepID=A0A8T1WKL5_9STRA|nr:hypothetical protein PHYPSEUDO_013442 [Phytophthora pseudosyringae]